MPARVIPFKGEPNRADLNPENAILDALLERGKNLPKRGNDISLSRDDEDLLVRHIKRDFEDTRGALEPYKSNMLEMTKNWRGTPDPKDFPFKDSANLRQPLTSVIVETMKARVRKALFGGDVWARIERMDATLTREQMEEQNQWFQWELQEIVHLDDIIDDALHQILVHGIAIPVPTYQHEEQFLHSTRRFAYQQGTPLTQYMTAITEQILTEKMSWGASLDEGPTTVTKNNEIGVFELSDGGSITFCLHAEDEGQFVLEADIWQREVTFDGARVECIRLEDLVVSPSADNIEALPFLGWRYWASASDLRRDFENGYYRDLGAKENERIANMAYTKLSDYIPQEETTEADVEQGMDTRDNTAVEPSRKWLEIYHWEGWWNWPKDANPYNTTILEPATQVAVEISPRAGRVMRINRLEDLNKDGKRSGVKFGFIKEPGRFFDHSLATWVRHSQAEMDAVHNQRVDAGILNNVPFGFYDPATGMKKEILQVEPGKFYPVRNPQGVNMPRSNWQPVISFQEEALIKRYAGEQSGISDQSTGSPISKRQSASEFIGTSGATDLRTEQFVTRLLRSMRELLYRILGLYQQFGPPRRIFRVAGPDGVAVTKMFERDRLQGRILLHLTGNVQQTNEQLQRQVATDMLQLLLNQVLIQLGIVKPPTIYGAIKLVTKLMHYEEVPLFRPDYPEESDPPNIEAKQMALGQPVKGPTIAENFNEHLQAHLILASNPEAMKLLGQQGFLALREHIMKTVQMQEQVKMLRQMQAAQALQMQKTMAAKGIRPGQEGSSSPGDQAGAGTEAEGVEGSEAQNE